MYKMTFSAFVFLFLSNVLRVQSGVPMCNDEGYMFPFDDLTPLDITRVKELVQLQIVARHGARTGNIPISEIFPHVDTSKPGYEWICNFTTVTSRTYAGEEFMAFQKNYIKGEQYVGRDCLDQQSLSPVIIQHKTTAKLIRNYYIGDKAYNLWSSDEINQIMYETFIERRYKDNNVPHLKIISSDIERAYATASVFFKYFLVYSSTEDADTQQSTDSYESMEALETWQYDRDTDYLYSYTHDPLNDPYIPQKVLGCANVDAGYDLKKYINHRGRSSKNAQKYLKSKYVQSFFKEWKKEVGTEFDFTYHKFKYCENIMWMYCGGLKVVPGMISQSLFEKVHNYTLEYRAKSLNNAISQETVTLASMPFAWILKTLMADRVHYLEGNEENINGYLDAKKAKLIFHSTRGISTLYFLRALNISSGMEPVYGNLVNFEMYSRSDSDYADDDDADNDPYNFGKYLFRILFMGKFLPFPGCEEDYRDGNSSLCNLSVFMEALKNLSMPMNEWEPYCRNITDTYFNEPKKLRDKLTYGYMVQAAKSAHDSGGTWLFVVGAMLGAVIVWFLDRKRYIKSVFKDQYDTI